MVFELSWMDIGAILTIGLVLIILLLIWGYVFSIWMFIDALEKRDILWITLFVISFFTGILPSILSTVYYYSVSKPAKKLTEVEKKGI